MSGRNVNGRRTYSITVTLAVAIGSLVFIGVASVLALGLTSAQRNTFALLQARSTDTIANLLLRVRQELTPPVEQVQFLHDIIVADDFDYTDTARMTDLLSGALAGAPQVFGVGFIFNDMKVLNVSRRRGGPSASMGDLSSRPLAMRAAQEYADKTGVFWGELIPALDDFNGTFINLRMPVRRDGEYLGLLVAVVSVARLSRFVQTLAMDQGSEAFILYGPQHVLAHPSLTAGFMRGLRGNREGVDQLLPRLDDVNDPVLAAIWGGGNGPNDVVPLRGPRPAATATGGHAQNVEGARYIYLYREVDTLGDTPWYIGLYQPAATFAAEIGRLITAGIAGLVVLVLSLIASVFLGRRIARPIKRIAAAANTISDLHLDTVDDLPASRIKELDDQARAFNSMVNGLRWFQNYVPRRLVKRLLEEQGETGGIRSVTREVTVIFTDIVAFTAQSEAMDADEVAALLNAHFSDVSAAVEAEEGTIDKYIGDSVMVFWGAPHRQPDHAQRAARAVIDMAERIRARNRDRSARGLSPIRVRIGVHSGEVVVGNIGAPGRVNYTIVGDAVNIGSRLEQLCKDVAPEADVVALMSAATLAQLGDNFPRMSAGAWALRGREGRVEVFRLV
ncbi:MAG: HAMP domain-containing protein [Proteobacteria bacterium]|nr:HAMP domain-containing protein [Pseudomonadota bacterium]MDA1058007.1 HAMP domain-containing protein [Pseudomonadota bacterium]